MKTKRISPTIEAELAEQMGHAARGVPTNLINFTRELLLWALPHYRRVSSLRVLRQAKVTLPVRSRTIIDLADN